MAVMVFGEGANLGMSFLDAERSAWFMMSLLVLMGMTRSKSRKPDVKSEPRVSPERDRATETFHIHYYANEALLSGLEAVMRDFPEAVWLFEWPSGRLRAINRAAEQLFGRPFDPHITVTTCAHEFGLYHLETGSCATELLPPVRAIKSGQAATVQNLRTYSPEKGWRWLVGWAAPLRGYAGEIIGVLTIFLDVTQDLQKERDFQTRIQELTREVEKLKNEVRTLEHKESHARTLANVGHLMTLLLHEMRNPLGAIANAADLLMDLLPEAGENEQELLRLISSEARRIGLLAQQVLTYARMPDPSPKPTLIHKVISQVLELLRHDPQFDPHIHIRTDFSPEVTYCSVDPELIRQVLWNLLLNAVQAMPEAGELVISTDMTANPRRPSLRCVRIAIRDSGVGIAPDDMGKLFDPFFTTKPFGTGLGLASARRIVEAHGGEITVQSSPGKGTTVTLFLPL